MRAMMTLPPRFLSGFALAATIAKDPGAELARAGLCANIAEPLTATARELMSLSKAERRERVGEWTRPAHADRCVWPREAAHPLRAYALLAQRARGNRAALPPWLSTAPLPRAGYTPQPQLVALLSRIAAHHADEAAWDE